MNPVPTSPLSDDTVTAPSILGEKAHTNCSFFYIITFIFINAYKYRYKFELDEVLSFEEYICYTTSSFANGRNIVFPLNKTA